MSSQSGEDKIIRLLRQLQSEAKNSNLDISAVLAKLTGAQQAPARSIVTDSGSVSAGFKSVVVINVGNNIATWLGVDLNPGEIREYAVTHLDSTLGAFSYDATVNGGTTLEINTLS